MVVTIRPLIEEDAYTSYKWRNDPEVFKYTIGTSKHVTAIDNELDWIRKVITNKDEYRCAIIADGKYVGNTYLTNISNGQCYFHIFLGDKTCWGKGIATEASKLIIKHGFEQLGIRKIYLEVRIQNLPALHLYDKLGFVKVSCENAIQTMILTKQAW